MRSQALEAGYGVAERFRGLLLIAAIYDVLLGLVFLFFSGPIFRALGIGFTADPVYVQLAAGLIALMGLGFFFAWREPLLNGDIVLIGIVGKAFYILLAIITQLQGGMPHGVFLLFAVIDALFFVAFLRYLRETSAARAAIAQMVAERTAL